MCRAELALNKVVVLLSGGVDSSTLAYYLDDRLLDIYCLSFMYGQRHDKEILAAKSISKALDVPHEIVDISGISRLVGVSALVNENKQIPDGHYAEESMKATVVPNRNMIMLSIAIGYAINNGCGIVAYAAHAGDHAIYPDCRPAFTKAMQQAAKVCHYEPVLIQPSFVNMTKAEVVKEGLLREVPFEKTWSCYKGGDIACGRCGTCVERLEAFELAGAKDPIEYEDREYWKEAIKSANR